MDGLNRLRKSALEFGRPSGAETVAGSGSQGSRPLARTPPWAILDRSSGAENRGVAGDLKEVILGG